MNRFKEWLWKKLSKSTYLEYLKWEQNRLKENLETLGGQGMIEFDEYSERELNLVIEKIEKMNYLVEVKSE